MDERSFDEQYSYAHSVTISDILPVLKDKSTTSTAQQNDPALKGNMEFSLRVYDLGGALERLEESIKKLKKEDPALPSVRIMGLAISAGFSIMSSQMHHRFWTIPGSAMERDSGRLAGVLSVCARELLGHLGPTSGELRGIF